MKFIRIDRSVAMVEITVWLLVCQDSFLPIKCQTSLNLMNHDCCKKAIVNTCHTEILYYYRLIQCNLDLVTLLVSAKTVTKSHNVTKSNDFI